MKSELYLFWILICSSFFCLGQEKYLFNEVELEKQNGTEFKIIEHFLKQSETEEYLLKQFVEGSKVYTYHFDTNNIVNSNNKAIKVEFPFGEFNFNLDLIEVKSNFYDYTITTSNDEEIIEGNSKSKHYRGVISGDENSLVALSFYENDISGFISNEEGNFNISTVQNENKIIVFKESNLAENSDFECLTKDEIIEGNKEEDLLNSTNNNSNCVRMYFEVDYELYQHFNNNINNVENFVMGLFNQVSTVYANENITIKTSDIFIWTSPDPYGNDIINELYTFVNNRPTFNGDLAHLLTLRSSSAGGAAFVDQLCNSSGYGHTSLSPNYQLFPIYSRQVKVVAHEIGHNFGSRHTHACVWNGNNTQIDDYGNTLSSGVAYNPQSCYSAPAILNVTPTIMSYYDSRGHGTFPLSNGFGIQPGNLIRSKYNNATCLTTCNTCVNDLIINVNSGIVDNQQAEFTITANNTVSSGSEAIYHAGEQVLLASGFDALNGSIFRSYIEGCTDTYISKSSGSEFIASEEKEAKLIEDVSLINKVSFFPNPTDGIFNLKVDTLSDSEMNVSIFNLTGKVVFTKEFTNVSSNQNISMNINKLPAGIYFIKIDVDGESFVKKLIKN